MSIRAAVVLASAPDVEPAEFDVNVTSDAGLEIERIYVRDRLGNTIYYTSIPDCGDHFDVRLQVSRRLLPVTVTVTTCGHGTSVPLGTFLSPPPDVRPCDPSDPTPPPQACLEAQQRITDLAGTIRSICIELVSLERSLREWRVILAVALSVAAALLIAAGIAALFGPVGWAVGAYLAAGAASAAFLAIFAGIVVGSYLNQRSNAFARLSSAQSAFSTAATDVRRLCCPHEITVSLETPGC